VRMGMSLHSAYLVSTTKLGDIKIPSPYLATSFLFHTDAHHIRVWYAKDHMLEHYYNC